MAAAWYQTLLTMGVVPYTGWFSPVAMSSKSAPSTSVSSSITSIQLASTFDPSDCGDPWVISGTALVIPSVPVWAIEVPAPVRLNQVSMVNWARSSLAGSPKVT